MPPRDAVDGSGLCSTVGGAARDRPSTAEVAQRGLGAHDLVAAAFEQAGMAGLLDDKRGRRGPVKLTDQIVEFLQTALPDRSGAELAAQVADRFGVVLHRRTVERARRR